MTFKKRKKNYLYILGYWLILVILPIIIVIVIGSIAPKYQRIADSATRWILYLSPIMYIVPLRMANLPTTKSKIMFIVWGLLLPIFIIFLFLLYILSQIRPTMFI